MIKQLERLVSYPARMLLVEGSLQDLIEWPGLHNSKISPNVVLGTLMKYEVRHNLNVQWATNPTCASMIAVKFFDNVIKWSDEKEGIK